MPAVTTPCVPPSPPIAVRVLGCSGAIAAHSRTTAFLVGERLLVDAGTGVGDLELGDMLRIDDVLLTHSHLDHIAALPLLADSVIRARSAQGRPPIRVHALPETLAALRTHIFNGVIWPDFTMLPHQHSPVLELQPLCTGQRLDIGKLVIEALPAHHTVPALGFAIWPGAPEHSACWVFTGDTAANPLLWARLRHFRVGQLVIETAFADDERVVAERSRHLHPAELARELGHAGQGCEVFITHIKPGEESAVMREIEAHRLPHRIHALHAGQVMSLGRPVLAD